MTPDSVVVDAVGSLRREIERNALRTRNGIKHLLGAEWSPPAPTPSDIVWQQGKAHVRRYRRSSPARLAPPVLAYLGLVSRSYCFDLAEGNSIVQRIMDAGFDAFVLDWGVPDANESAFTLETYVQDLLPRAVRAVRRATQADEVNMIAYCMGGDLALLALAAQPDLPVRNLVTIATPVDFRHLGALADALRAGQFPLEAALDETGNVPPGLIENFFKVRRPTSDVVQYANLWENLWNDRYMEGYQAMGRWVREHVPMAGAAYLQIARQWLLENAFMEDTLWLGGRHVSLSAIRVPTLAVIATRDDMVPLPAAAPIVDLLTGTRVELLRVDAGHASLTTGRTAAQVTLRGLLDWLRRHSEEAE